MTTMATPAIRDSISAAGRVTNAALITGVRRDDHDIRDFVSSQVCVRKEHIWSVGGGDLNDALGYLAAFHPVQQVWIHYTGHDDTGHGSYMLAITRNGTRVYVASADRIREGFALASTTAVASGPMKGWFLLKRLPAR